MGAGLGGGSSDAAAVLLALRELTGVKCDDATLSEMASRLGSDVPFFITRTPAICRGRGEIVVPSALKEKLQGLLVHPGFGVPTPWAYKTYAANPQQGETGRAFDGFTLRNDLEPPAFSKYLWLPTVKAWFRKQPEVLDSLMSGSGSSVFALTKSEGDIADLRARFSPSSARFSRRPSRSGSRRTPCDGGKEIKLPVKSAARSATATFSKKSIFIAGGFARVKAAMARAWRDFGQIPKWPTGEDCKSSGFAFTGSNPVLPTPPLTEAK